MDVKPGDVVEISEAAKGLEAGTRGRVSSVDPALDRATLAIAIGAPLPLFVSVSNETLVPSESPAYGLDREAPAGIEPA